MKANQHTTRCFILGFVLFMFVNKGFTQSTDSAAAAVEEPVASVKKTKPVKNTF